MTTAIELVEGKEGQKSTRRFRTPVGELREESVYSPLSCSAGITKHFVESEQDLDVLLYVLQHRRLAAGEPGRLARAAASLAEHTAGCRASDCRGRRCRPSSSSGPACKTAAT